MLFRSNLLSGVRLGVGLGLIPDVGTYVLNRMLVHIQPAHLAARLRQGTSMTRSEVAVSRATYVREALSQECEPGP